MEKIVRVSCVRKVFLNAEPNAMSFLLLASREIVAVVWMSIFDLSCEMPCVAPAALINPKVAGMAHANEGIPLGQRTLLVERNLSALAQWSAEAPICIECFYWILLPHVASV